MMERKPRLVVRVLRQGVVYVSEVPNEVVGVSESLRGGIYGACSASRRKKPWLAQCLY